MDAQTGTFQVKSWDEHSQDDPGGMKLTRVRATMAYEGAIAGEGSVEFLMYSPDGLVTHFVGLERVSGSVAGRAGSVVFRHNGTFADGVAKCRWIVVPGSGTEGLRGLVGEGVYGEEPPEAGHGGRAPLSFSFAFEGPA